MFDPFGGDDSFGAWLFEHSNDEEEDKENSELTKFRANRINNREDENTMENRNDSSEEDDQYFLPPSTSEKKEGFRLDFNSIGKLYLCRVCNLNKSSSRCLYHDRCNRAKPQWLYDMCSPSCVYAMYCVEDGFCARRKQPIFFMDGIQPNEVFPVSKDTSIVFKGLYLGMDINQACEKLNELLKNIRVQEIELNIRLIVDESVSDYKILVQEKTGGRSKIWKGWTSLYGGEACAWARKKDKRIYRFVFFPCLVDALFNVSDLDAAEFIIEFSKAYKIPIDRWISGKFTNEDGSELNAAVYEDRIKGWAIFISGRKNLLVKLIKKRKSSSERKFD